MTMTPRERCPKIEARSSPCAHLAGDGNPAELNPYRLYRRQEPEIRSIETYQIPWPGRPGNEWAVAR